MNLELSPQLPTDRQESEILELKSLAALDEPETIARGAVAMLNSKGGEVWVGIKESHGRNEVEAMPEVEAARAKRRLQDHLLDVIEPTPAAGDVAVTDVPVGSGAEQQGRVLRVTLTPAPSRRPYALRRHGGRYFLRRFGDRIVPMSREDIAKDFRAERPSPTSGATGEILQDEIKSFIERATSSLWLGIDPEQAGELRIQDLDELLMDPTLSGTPRASYNFTNAAYRGAVKRDNSRAKPALMVGDEVLSLRLFRSGGVRFEAALEENFWAGRVPFVEADHLLSPERLLGYLISVVRLVGKLLEEAAVWHRPPQGDLWTALGIAGLRGWGLLPGNLAEWPAYRYQIRRFQDQDLLLQEPLRFAQEDLKQRPDECGMRLIERIYDAFEIDRLPSIAAAALGHAGLPAIGRDGYSRWVRLDLGGGDPKVARLRRDPMRPGRFEWETREGERIPGGGRWVHGWSYVE
jgi:Schlafen, AlbA_2